MVGAGHLPPPHVVAFPPPPPQKRIMPPLEFFLPENHQCRRERGAAMMLRRGWPSGSPHRRIRFCWCGLLGTVGMSSGGHDRPHLLLLLCCFVLPFVASLYPCSQNAALPMHEPVTVCSSASSWFMKKVKAHEPHFISPEWAESPKQGVFSTFSAPCPEGVGDVPPPPLVMKRRMPWQKQGACPIRTMTGLWPRDHGWNRCGRIWGWKRCRQRFPAHRDQSSRLRQCRRRRTWRVRLP